MPSWCVRSTFYFYCLSIIISPLGAKVPFQPRSGVHNRYVWNVVNYHVLFLVFPLCFKSAAAFVWIIKLHVL
jgi:hypothetical protein